MCEGITADRHQHWSRRPYGRPCSHRCNRHGSGSGYNAWPRCGRGLELVDSSWRMLMSAEPCCEGRASGISRLMSLVGGSTQTTCNSLKTWCRKRVLIVTPTMFSPSPYVVALRPAVGSAQLRHSLVGANTFMNLRHLSRDPRDVITA